MFMNVKKVLIADEGYFTGEQQFSIIISINFILFGSYLKYNWKFLNIRREDY